MINSKAIISRKDRIKMSISDWWNIQGLIYQFNKEDKKCYCREIRPTEANQLEKEPKILDFSQKSEKPSTYLELDLIVNDLQRLYTSILNLGYVLVDSKVKLI